MKENSHPQTTWGAIRRWLHRLLEYAVPCAFALFLCLIIVVIQFEQIILLDRMNHAANLTHQRIWVGLGILGFMMLAPILYSNLLTSTAPEIAHLWRHIWHKEAPKIKRSTASCSRCGEESKFSLVIDGKPTPLCKTHLSERLETDQRALAAMVVHFIYKMHLSKSDQED